MNLGKSFIFVGIIFFMIGVIILFLPKFFNIFRLPGDIYYKKGNFSFYFPFTTSLIFSLILTVILNLIRNR
ncbi:MAG: DUF2905 domain-containing protein [Elusimicrobiota bacterium]